MYLKSIEIHGFKSFANKIVFEFPQGITGIVGPNGSGKSNVADAVRWVLGEQKIKQLRGSKMEDVIFAGTAQRKPQSYAFVAITLNNADHKLKIDFDEVIISRRVFRSGESEYMINGSVCRLRDVQELFYDTGIGKEGYSIIGQGQIDKILQGKPEERRELFDEAAGIVKYKKRKIIALRKLESERENLSRVNDILSELKHRVGPLQRQSEAAEKFVTYKNDLKRYDINLFLTENGDIKEKIKDYERKEAIARDQLNRVQEAFSDTKEEYEAVSHVLEEIDGQIDSVKNSISRCNIIKESLQGQINVLNEQIRSISEAKKTYLTRVAEIENEIASAVSERDRLTAEKAENQTALSKAIVQANSRDSYCLDIRQQIEESAQNIEDKKSYLIDLVNKKGEIMAAIERLNAMVEQMQKRRTELKNSFEKYASDKADQERKLEELNKQYEEARKDYADCESKIALKEAACAETDKQIKAYNLQLLAEKEQLIKDQARLESLRNITERYEGYGNTIKEIMKIREKNPGIHGVVADIIRTEKKYEIAIETALGGSIQNVVTDTETTAKNVIEYLKRERLGRATFLPLKSVTGRGEFRNTDVLSEKGALGIASSLVSVDEKYRGVANYLLGKIVVVDHIDNAISIARKYSYSIVLVTLEGELLNRGGSLSGGAYKNKSNLLGRRREIEELEKSIREFSVRQEDLKKKISTAQKKQEDLILESDELKAAFSEYRILLNTININLQSAKARDDELKDSADRAGRESRSLEEESEGISGETFSLKGELAKNQTDTEETKALILQMEDELSKLREKEAKELLLSQNLKVQQMKLSEQNNYLSESLNRVENNIEKLNADKKSLRDSNENSDDEIKEKKEEAEKINISLLKAADETVRLKEELVSLEGSKEKKTAEYKAFISKREEYTEQAADLDKEIFRLSSMKEKMEEKFENKADYIWEEYQLTFNNAMEFKDGSLTDIPAMKEKISEIKANIKSLGNINVSAIEEYKEVKERFEFLSGQHTDLIRAEADLEKIIKDLDREMRRQFNEEFKKIRMEFSRVFKQMFGGGTGSIELEEGTDVLDAGISIIAQPPGKKLQNMMQLSGGEKALTAIAVLFAIQNLKPSPFCILDEIEAALDDSNIFRYAQYLQILSKDIQFIIITHRKGTMEAADRLYGITMQERGVSTLISVNLADVEDEQESFQ